jgi:hypothetical protein
MKKKVEEKSIKIFEARVKHAIDTNAIGFTLNGIKLTNAVINRLIELKKTGGVRKAQIGTPVIIYF